MCGIIGCAGKIGAKEKKAFGDLLSICQVRGRDSTGVFSVSAAGTVIKMTKDIGTPERLMDRKSYDNVLEYNPSVLVGHCRHKTAGQVNVENAHPFEFPNVIGVHNGTLHYSWNREETAKDFDVDSEWLYSLINEQGVEESLNSISKDGAWALVYYDKQERRLNFIRNSKRPLYFCWTKDKDVMFWASESWMLCAVDRLLDCAILDKEDGTWTMSLPVDTLWSFKIDRNVGFGKDVFKMSPPKEIEGGANFILPLTTSRGSGGNLQQGGRGVIHPFQKAMEDEEDPLDDPLPELGRNSKSGKGTGIGGQAGKKNTTGPGKGSQTSSSNSSDSTTASKNINKSPRPTLSLVETSTSISPTTNKSECCDESEKCSHEPSVASCRAKNRRSLPQSGEKQVSLRNVAGVWYISSKITGLEITETEFEKNTDAKCTWCREPIGGLEEIHTLRDRHSFICDKCGGAE